MSRIDDFDWDLPPVAGLMLLTLLSIIAVCTGLLLI
jgi:hypothetical protein